MYLSNRNPVLESLGRSKTSRSEDSHVFRIPSTLCNLEYTNMLFEQFTRLCFVLFQGCAGRIHVKLVR